MSKKQKILFIMGLSPNLCKKSIYYDLFIYNQVSGIKYGLSDIDISSRSSFGTVL